MMEMTYIMDIIDFGFGWLTVIWIIAIALISLGVYFLIAGRKSGSLKISQGDGPIGLAEKNYTAGKITEEGFGNIKKELLN